MEILAKKLKEIAARKGVSDAAMARHIGLDERRYAHYAAGRRKPDLETFLRIAIALETTPNDLLGIEETFLEDRAANTLVNRFVRAASSMSSKELEIVVVQAEAISTRTR